VSETQLWCLRGACDVVPPVVRVVDVPASCTLPDLHDVLQVAVATPGCVDGGDAAPPEGCGGPYGYAELLRALADPEHVDHDRLRRVFIRLRAVAVGRHSPLAS